MSKIAFFGHVPSIDEMEAKAFVTAQEPWRDQWSWGAYCAGLADAGVDDEQAKLLLMAACNGEFSGNIEFGGCE